MIVSFDIFETVVVRAIASPDGVFRRVATRLIERGCLLPEERETWVDLRYREEIRLWEEQGPRFSLHDIYYNLQKMAGPGRDATPEVELEVENELWHPVPSSMMLLELERKKENKIVFISDGYFPEIFLKKHLLRLSIARPEDEVFSSCEHGAAKHDGTLYKKLRERLGKKWVRHYGNSREADILRARTAKLEAVHLPAGNLSSREQTALKIFRKHKAADVGENIIGAARLARLNVEGKKVLSDLDRGRLKVLSGVAAPLFFLYAGWLVKQAEKDKVEKLAFLSRDGFVIKQIFDKLEHKIQSVYVLASRKALYHSFFLSIVEGKSKDFLFLPRYALRESFCLTGLSDEEIKQLVSLIDSELGKSEGEVSCHEFWELSHKNQRIRDFLTKIFSQKEKLAKRYLKPIFSGRVATVDLGWLGRIQFSLELLLGKNVLGYYMGLSQRAIQLRGNQRTFLFDDCERERSLEYLNCAENIYTLLESFTSAPHGSVLCYTERESGEVGAMYDTEENSVQDSEISLSFFREFSEVMPANVTCDFEKTDVIAIEIITTFLREPDKEESESWGSLGFKDADTEGEIAPPMRTLTLKSILKALLGGTLSYGKTLWPAATRQRTPFGRHLIYRCLFFYRHRVVRLLAGTKPGCFVINSILKRRKKKS